MLFTLNRASPQRVVGIKHSNIILNGAEKNAGPDVRIVILLDLERKRLGGCGEGHRDLGLESDRREHASLGHGSVEGETA